MNLSSTKYMEASPCLDFISRIFHSLSVILQTVQSVHTNVSLCTEWGLEA